MAKKIAVIGDVHGHRPRLEAVLAPLAAQRPDLAVLVGDIGKDPPRRDGREAHWASVRGVIGRVREALGAPMVFVPGNHDLPEPPPDLDAVNADGQVIEAAGLRIFGFGGAGPALFGFPYEWTDEQAERRLWALLREAPKLDLFLSHAPPYKSKLDRLRGGTPVGSRAVAEWIVRTRPRLFLCGHIHESGGTDVHEGVPCLNAAALGEPYGQEIAWIVDWEEGPLRARMFHRRQGKFTEQALEFARADD